MPLTKEQVEQAVSNYVELIKAAWEVLPRHQRLWNDKEKYTCVIIEEYPEGNYYFDFTGTDRWGDEHRTEMPMRFLYEPEAVEAEVLQQRKEWEESERQKAEEEAEKARQRQEQADRAEYKRLKAKFESK